MKNFLAPKNKGIVLVEYKVSVLYTGVLWICCCKKKNIQLGMYNRVAKVVKIHNDLLKQ